MKRIFITGASSGMGLATATLLSGRGPCIHHFAVEVEDIEKATQQIKANGADIVSDPGVIPVKFRAPGGTIAELVPLGRYQR